MAMARKIFNGYPKKSLVTALLLAIIIVFIFLAVRGVYSVGLCAETDRWSDRSETYHLHRIRSCSVIEEEERRSHGRLERREREVLACVSSNAFNVEIQGAHLRPTKPIYTFLVKSGPKTTVDGSSKDTGHQPLNQAGNTD